MNGKPFEPALLERLSALAESERNDYATVDALAQEWQRSRGSLLFKISILRGARRARAAELTRLAEQEGGGAAVPVACAAPAHDGLASGQQDRGCTPAAPVTLAPAVHDPRTVTPAAGDALRESAAPAVPSPGLCWARAAMQRGVSLEKVLRSAGDRLTWRDRDQLRSAPAAQREAQHGGLP